MATTDMYDTAHEINDWDPTLTVMEQARALHADAGFMASITITTAAGLDPILTAADARENDCEIDPVETLHVEVAVNFGQKFGPDGKENFNSRPMGGRDEALAILRAFPRRVFLVEGYLPQAKGRLVELAERAAVVTIGSM